MICILMFFVEHMHQHLLKSEYINVDETTLEVLELLKTEGRQNSYVWVYKTGRSEDKQMAFIDLKTTESTNELRIISKVIQKWFKAMDMLLIKS